MNDQEIARTLGATQVPPSVYSLSNCRLLGEASSMVAAILRRYAIAGVALTSLSLVTSACAGNGDAEPAPTGAPPSSATASTSEPPTASPTPTLDADSWESKFSAAQLKDYEAALQRWQSYESRSEPIWAKGEATSAAEKLFKEFFPHPAWMDYWERLQGYEEINVKVSGTPTVYWSKAKSVSARGRSVQVQQCVDYTPVARTQAGDEISRPTPEPQLRTIFLSQPEGYGWLIYGVKELVDGKPKPCTS